jgi:hypothetical protein
VGNDALKGNRRDARPGFALSAQLRKISLESAFPESPESFEACIYRRKRGGGNHPLTIVDFANRFGSLSNMFAFACKN